MAIKKASLPPACSFFHVFVVLWPIMCLFSCQVPLSSMPSSIRALMSDTPTSVACLAPGSILLRTPQRATSTCMGLVEARDVPPTKTAPATCATGEMTH